MNNINHFNAVNAVMDACYRSAGSGRWEPVDMLAVIFNPSFPYRLTHTVSAFLVTTGFVILGVGALYLRKGRAVEESRVMVKMSLLFLSVTSMSARNSGFSA